MTLGPPDDWQERAEELYRATRDEEVLRRYYRRRAAPMRRAQAALLTALLTPLADLLIRLDRWVVERLRR